jgi:polyketide synthase PksN
MDQFSFYRNQLADKKQRRGKTVSINWPLWEEGGMGTDQASQELLKQAMGIHPMQTQTGFEVFYRSLELEHGQTLVMEGEIQQIRITVRSKDSGSTFTGWTSPCNGDRSKQFDRKDGRLLA